MPLLCPAPLSERTDPKITIMLRADQPPQIEQVLHSSMGAEKSLRLPHRFESPHSSLPEPGSFMLMPGGNRWRF